VGGEEHGRLTIFAEMENESTVHGTMSLKKEIDRYFENRMSFFEHGQTSASECQA
jgi:hypothetical protein